MDQYQVRDLGTTVPVRGFVINGSNWPTNTAFTTANFDPTTVEFGPPIKWHFQNEGPVIAVACRDWQNEWGIAQNWQKLNFRNIKLKLKSIQKKDREEAVFSLTLAVIKVWDLRTSLTLDGPSLTNWNWKVSGQIVLNGPWIPQKGKDSQWKNWTRCKTTRWYHWDDNAINRRQVRAHRTIIKTGNRRTRWWCPWALIRLSVFVFLLVY